MTNIFWVYPPIDGEVLLEYSALPQISNTDLTTVDFPLPEEYAPAAVDYAVYRTLAEDNSDSANLERSEVFLKKFKR